jgi:deoxyribonuclease (pyrimidine dimer)
MTRINVVPPEELTGRHLVAEYRELPRVYGLVLRAIARGEKPVLAGRYTFGTGHVRFFYARLGWVDDRCRQLRVEMCRRGYKITEYPAVTGIPREWYGTWKADAWALSINRARIAERLGK